MKNPFRWLRRGGGGGMNIYDIGEATFAARYPLNKPAPSIVVNKGPSLDEWRKRMKTDPISRGEYSRLRRTYGELMAEFFIDVVVDTVATPPRDSLDKVTPTNMVQYIQHELDTFHERKRYIGSLMKQQVAGSLGPLLDANLLDEKEYYVDPLIAGLDGRELAIDMAANWICSMQPSEIPMTRLMLVDYIPAMGGASGKTGNAAMGTTEHHLRTIHRLLAADSERFRFVASGKDPYPSSIGGSMLLKYIFLISGNSNWPRFADPRWDSIAMFYLASIVSCQGFGDGNKRAGHSAYAICMIKNNHYFKAPTSQLEGQLFRMLG